MNNTPWTENIIIADGDYVDKVAFDLVVNFERMIGRPIVKADMARWVECIALDGGLREGDHETTVVLIHDVKHQQMDNFMPGSYATELNGQAFRSHLGEFVFNAVTTEGLATNESLLTDTLNLAMSREEVKRLMVIPDDTYYNKVCKVLRDVKAVQETTVFTMQPMAGDTIRHELLGYSLMAALGIRSEEIMEKVSNS